MRTVGYRKGIHPPECKDYTEGRPIEVPPLPESVIIPLHQHTGSPCEPIVSKGDEVKMGERIGESSSFISAPIHSSISGRVTDIAEFPHPIGTKVRSILIESDSKDEWKRRENHPDYSSLPADRIREIIREAGIVGLGGATFPTSVKLSPPEGKRVNTFILNGAECEPYLTADHRLMVEEAPHILVGMRIIMQALGVSKGYIAVETNKPDALKIMDDLTSDEKGIEVIALKTKYPGGGERQLIQAILGREVPSGGLPWDVGVVVNNVGTALAVKEAVVDGKPLIERVVTITGSGIREPKNLRVRIGTSFKNLVQFCGGNGEWGKVIMGGPMMGIAQYTLDVPVVKGTCGILVMLKGEVREEEPHVCIRCASCVRDCPAILLPTTIATLAENGRFDEAERYGALDCIECGVCVYVCPARIPLVQLIKYAKAKILAKR